MDTELKSQLTNFSVNEETLQDYAKILLLCDIVWGLFYFILRLFLFITAFLGFGFYLWFLSTSDGQTQTRLLNILNGYMAGICMGLSPMLFINFYASDEIFKLGFSFRITAPFIIAIPITFLLISFATILNHFKPDAYLKLSLHWKHKIVIPFMLFSLIFTEQLANHSCPKENFMECEASKIRRFLFIPASVTSFLCQLIVIVDVFFGCSYLYKTLRGLFQPNQVTSISDGCINDVQNMSSQASASHPPTDPTQQLDQHLVS